MAKALASWLVLATLLSAALPAGAAQVTSVRGTNISVMRAQAISACKRQNLPQNVADQLAKLQIPFDQNAFCGCVGQRLMHDARINGLIAGKEPILADDALERVLKGKAAAAGFSCLGEEIDKLVDQPAP
ncbi:hypothetical protein [Silvimonas iriomotensis]|uniref:Secreted protein n=1 Tax=Silvimonas iriomotensis TaxID=449662 RepID=A0ABQ2P9L8_9NEIS|nr:hypothetical protein [Silvimonas iriomotensis]GGP21242.1 hypothetical protein GCM10010970_19520 [Silvimonas iriomotensis]